MDANEMTPEQLMELAKEKAGGEPDPETRTIEVDGQPVTVRLDRLRKWKAMELVERVDTAKGTTRWMAALDLVEYVTDMDRESVVARFGGDDAEAADVIAFAFEVIKGCYPKN